MAYWLFKSEPGRYSFADLMAAPGRTTGWDGVRHYQARNYLRDTIAVGDGVLFYHSSVENRAIAGIAEVVRAGHPDPTAFDPKSEQFEPGSDRKNPKWYQVEIRGVRAIEPPLELSLLRTVPALKAMELLRMGNRLSIQPVRPDEWAAILELAGDDGHAP
jgi:predicted RNA-binding protein with PUA-like domain